MARPGKGAWKEQRARTLGPLVDRAGSVLDANQLALFKAAIAREDHVLDLQIG